MSDAPPGLLEVLRGRSAGNCECCRIHPATEKSHRVNRSQGGQWDPDNVLHACHECHAWFTSFRDYAHDAGWILKLGGPPDTFYVGMVPVWLNSLTLDPGWYFLDHDGGVQMAAMSPVSPAPVLPPWVPPAILPPRPITVTRWRP